MIETINETMLEKLKRYLVNIISTMSKIIIIGTIVYIAFEVLVGTVVVVFKILPAILLLLGAAAVAEILIREYKKRQSEV